MPSEQNPWTTKTSRVRFENPWIKVVQNDVINPIGNDGEYTVVHFKHRAVAIVPIDDDGNTWLVGQYRYTTQTYEWEIPAGGAKPPESTLECARRELREETGLIATQWDLISENVQLSNSISDELAFTYVARDLTQAAVAPEETEALSLKKLPLREAIRMALDGRIRDAFSVVSLLKVDGLRSRGELDVPL